MIPDRFDHDFKTSPFLKWAGGKRWLVERQLEIFPTEIETYFEPFLGSGAVFFHLAPKRSVLSDINQELILTYRAIKEDWLSVQAHLEKHQRHHSKEYYYKVRSSQPRLLATKAARMLYLNRTCWNGLYRVNQRGRFNVPIGTKTDVLFDIESFPSLTKILKNAEILHSDFEAIINRAKKNDFVFVDPPYTVKHNHNGFIKYNETLFAWDDQLRLKDSVDRAVSRGARVLVTNAAHKSIQELYVDYTQIELARKNTLSGKPNFRGTFDELIIKCWH